MFLLKRNLLVISLVLFSLLGLVVSGCGGQATKGVEQKSQPLDDIKLKGVDSTIRIGVPFQLKDVTKQSQSNHPSVKGSVLDYEGHDKKMAIHITTASYKPEFFKLNKQYIEMFADKTIDDARKQPDMSNFRTTRPRWMYTASGTEILWVTQHYAKNIAFEQQSIFFYDQNSLWAVCVWYQDGDKEAEKQANNILLSIKPVK